MTKKIEMSNKEAKAVGKIGTPELEKLKNHIILRQGFKAGAKLLLYIVWGGD